MSVYFVAITANTRKKLKKVLSKLDEEVTKFNLEFNLNKTKYGLVIEEIYENKEKYLRVSLINQ